MSKIICEICGTVYPDNATMCPICGCPRGTGVEADLPAEEAAAAGVRTTQRVKGGRFSNKNVKKRNQAANADNARRSSAQREKKPKDPDRESSNRGLVITVLILLAAVILLGAYIGIRFFGGTSGRDDNSSTTGSTTIADTTTTAPQETGVACTDLKISGIDLEQGVRLVGEGKTWRMAVAPIPEDTTEEITYTSSDERVVAVSVNGSRVDLICMGSGTAAVTVSCGSVSKQFTVECEIPEPTEPTEESTETSETTEPEETTKPTEPGTLSLSSNDFTLFSEGETATLAPGKGISPAQCTWTSEDEGVATVENGKVTAVAPGMTNIIVEFNGQKATCIVRCNWVEQTDPSDGTEPTDPTDETDPSDETDPTQSGGSEGETWTISSSDVTIAVGESFTLSLRSSSGETAEVTWNAGAGVSVSGNTVTGVEPGTYNVSCIYNGEGYSCIVRVN